MLVLFFEGSHVVLKAFFVDAVVAALGSTHTLNAFKTILAVDLPELICVKFVLLRRHTKFLCVLQLWSLGQRLAKVIRIVACRYDSIYFSGLPWFVR